MRYIIKSGYTEEPVYRQKETSGSFVHWTHTFSESCIYSKEEMEMCVKLYYSSVITVVANEISDDEASIMMAMHS